MKLDRLSIILISAVVLLIFGSFTAAFFSQRTKPDTLINPKTFGSQCKLIAVCNNIAEINCQSELDGPLYYVDAQDGTILEYCGGSCMGGPRGPYCQHCPPVNWTCAK
ncbi:hypothetical protein HGA91_05795 [candidate division WWE3 bacterium]|nr:hypothetical protein [candidate division WWE3 bacterium]